MNMQKSSGNETEMQPMKKRLKGDPVQRALGNVNELVSMINDEKTTSEKKLQLLSERGHFPGRAPVPQEKLERHSRGDGLDVKGVRYKILRNKLQKHEKNIEFSKEQAARAELLLPEESGYLEADDGEMTTQYTQRQIAANVDITSATKHFELQLTDFGPYRVNYSRSGRYMLLGGRRGHVAAFDWVTKKLSCEMNVMEEVFDVQWLHINTMYAVAQKKWVYIYDNQGIEMHCVKNLDHVLRMEFLPYHFLLATANERGRVSWLDISIGKIIAHTNTRMGRLNIMTQNPYNALLCTGHPKGIVSMWSPNTEFPVAKMLCHPKPLQALAIDPSGRYMATSAMDNFLKIWDIRKLEGPVQNYQLRSPPSHLAFSQRKMLATACGNVVQVYKDICISCCERPYMCHKVRKTVANLQFCPYEDVLGIGHGNGFSSMLVPGSGEPNFDALESNPFQTKSQRKEWEVKALLEKVQPELICLEPNTIAEVDVPTLQDKVEATKKLLHVKTPKIDFTPRNSGKRKGTAKIVHIKKKLHEQGRKAFVHTIMAAKPQLEKEIVASSAPDKPCDVLDRFKPKPKK